MKPIFSNRYADAAAKTIILFGIIHFAILAGIAIRGDVEVLNAFNILQLDLLIPSLHSGVFNFVWSYFVVLAGYGLAYLYLARPAGEDRPAIAAQADRALGK